MLQILVATIHTFGHLFIIKPNNYKYKYKEYWSLIHYYLNPGMFMFTSAWPRREYASYVALKLRKACPRAALHTHSRTNAAVTHRVNDLEAVLPFI